jgi:predicted phosphodiesterase
MPPNGMSTRTILCLGDLHLGVRPSRLPADLDPRPASVAAVWRRAVELALREEVGLVLLSGDVVDRANRYFEAFGPLEEGLGRLADGGIDVVAVAGNHDFDVLPRLAGTVSGRRFRLLGEGGRWERFTWADAGGRPLLHVDGWSFPARDVRADPVAAHDLPAPADEAPVLGLVHGDLDLPASTNAPLARATLEACGGGRVAAWLLGHVHKPGLVSLSRGRWALYPGSPQPLDPTETGSHGAWLVELADGRLGAPEPVPLATLRWEALEIDLAGTADADAVRAAIVEAVRGAADGLAASGPGAPEHVLLRAALIGRTRAHGELGSLLAELEAGTHLELPSGDARARLLEVADRTRPALDLADLARGEGPPAVLAGLLLELEGSAAAPAPSERRLLGEAEEAVRGVFAARPYADLPGSAPAAEDLRVRTAAAAWSLLDALLLQKGEPTGAAGRAAGAPPE